MTYMIKRPAFEDRPASERPASQEDYERWVEDLSKVANAHHNVLNDLCKRTATLEHELAEIKAGR